MKYAFFALTLVIPTGAISATFSCSPPKLPYCVQQYGKFAGPYEFDDCKIELEKLKKSSAEFIECLNEASENVARDYKKAVNKFNDRASSSY